MLLVPIDVRVTMSRSFTRDRGSFEQLLDSWQTYARSFVERSSAQDWEFRVPHGFVGSVAHNAGYVTVLDLQSRSKCKFLQVVQFEPNDQVPRATVWMQKFGDPTRPEENVDLLRVNCSDVPAQMPGLLSLFEAFVVNDASILRMEELIRSAGMEPV